MDKSKPEINWIEEYYHQIDTGKITACKNILSVYRHLVKMINAPPAKCPYHFDNKKADYAIKFIEGFCRLSKGKNAGKLIQLELWQKALISAIFGFVDENGLRQYREVMLLVGRKNGKSSLASCIALYGLLADRESAPEVVSAATKRDQAKIVWNETVRMIKKDPYVRKYCRCRVADIYCDMNDGNFKPLASDSNSLDGLNVSLGILDEIHAWQDTNLYDVIADSQTARSQPLILITSTAGFVRENIYDNKYKQAEDVIDGYDGGNYKDDRFLPIIYELDDKTEWQQQSMWIKANPALGTIKDFHALAEKVQRAKSGHKDKNDLLTKDFNFPLSSTRAFLSWSDIKSAESFDISSLVTKSTYAIGGFDLSKSRDLTSACIIFKTSPDSKIYVLSMSWITEQALSENEESNIPYQKWIDNGWLRVCPGNLIDYKEVIQWLMEARSKHKLYLYKVGYDRYSANYMVQEMENETGPNVLDQVIQGAKTLSIPLEFLKSQLEAKNLVYNQNPVLMWCLANLEVQIDSNGNFKPTKNRNLSTRNDAAMALLDALTSYLRNLDEYNNLISK